GHRGGADRHPDCPDCQGSFYRDHDRSAGHASLEDLTTMAHWFLSTRAQSIGGPVAPVSVLDADRPGHPYDLTGELVDAVRGREIFFGVHGFNVHQDDGIKHLGYW